MNRIVLSAVGALTLCGAAAAQSGNAASGKVRYTTKYRCYSCHGYSGQTGPGAHLVPMKMTQAQFMAFVRHPRAPRAGSSPAGQQDRMQPYSAKVLPDAELIDIYAYIKTLPDAPSAKDVPLLRQLKSEAAK